MYSLRDTWVSTTTKVKSKRRQQTASKSKFVSNTKENKVSLRQYYHKYFLIFDLIDQSSKLLHVSTFTGEGVIIILCLKSKEEGKHSSGLCWNSELYLKNDLKNEEQKDSPQDSMNCRGIECRNTDNIGTRLSPRQVYAAKGLLLWWCRRRRRNDDLALNLACKKGGGDTRSLFIRTRWESSNSFSFWFCSLFFLSVFLAEQRRTNERGLSDAHEVILRQEYKACCILRCVNNNSRHEEPFLECERIISFLLLVCLSSFCFSHFFSLFAMLFASHHHHLLLQNDDRNQPVANNNNLERERRTENMMIMLSSRSLYKITTTYSLREKRSRWTEEVGISGKVSSAKGVSSWEYTQRHAWLVNSSHATFSSRFIILNCLLLHQICLLLHQTRLLLPWSSSRLTHSCSGSSIDSDILLLTFFMTRSCTISSSFCSIFFSLLILSQIMPFPWLIISTNWYWEWDHSDDHSRE